MTEVGEGYKGTADLISRAAAVRALVSSNGDYLDALERIEKIPAVDAAPVKPTRYQEGRWFNTWRCGACGGTLVFRNGTDKPKYCTDCGRAVKWE